MGVLLAIILLFNMVGALTVVPALIGILKPRGFPFFRSEFEPEFQSTEDENPVGNRTKFQSI